MKNRLLTNTAFALVCMCASQSWGSQESESGTLQKIIQKTEEIILSEMYALGLADDVVTDEKALACLNKMLICVNLPSDLQNEIENNLPELVNDVEKELSPVILHHPEYNLLFALPLIYSPADKRDIPRAIEYLILAADAKVTFNNSYQADCELLLARLYSGMDGGTLDYQKAFMYLKKAADRNNVEAMFHLAGRYANGQGCDLNEAEAARLYETVLEKDARWLTDYSPFDPFLFLGKYYHYQSHKSKECKRKEQMYLLRAMQKDIIEAAIILGNINRKTNPNAAYAYYERALKMPGDHSTDSDMDLNTKMGHAQYALFKIEKNKSAEKMSPEAEKYVNQAYDCFLIASDWGSREASYWAATCLESIDYKTGKHFRQKIELFERAIKEKGPIDSRLVDIAKAKVARGYFSARGFPDEQPIGRKYLLESAANNCIEAKTLLASFYGFGVASFKKNITKALELLEDINDDGRYDNQIGEYYFESKKYSKALEYYLRAKKNGFEVWDERIEEAQKQSARQKSKELKNTIPALVQEQVKKEVEALEKKTKDSIGSFWHKLEKLSKSDVTVFIDELTSSEDDLNEQLKSARYPAQKKRILTEFADKLSSIEQKLKDLEVQQQNPKKVKPLSVPNKRNLFETASRGDLLQEQRDNQREAKDAAWSQDKAEQLRLIKKDQRENANAAGKRSPSPPQVLEEVAIEKAPFARVRYDDAETKSLNANEKTKLSAIVRCIREVSAPLVGDRAKNAVIHALNHMGSGYNCTKIEDPQNYVNAEKGAEVYEMRISKKNRVLIHFRQNTFYPEAQDGNNNNNNPETIWEINDNKVIVCNPHKK